MYTINFTCPNNRTDTNGLSRIQLWINVNGKRKTVYLELKAQPSTFKKLLYSKKANNVNVYCNGIRHKIDTFFITQTNATLGDILEFIKAGFESPPHNLHP